MTVFWNTLHCLVVRLTSMILVFAAVTVIASAQSTQAFFERSTLTGSGNTITAANVPVTIPTAGITIYLNVTMQFNVDSNGNLTLSSGYPQVVAAPTLLSSSFRAGTYIGPSSVLNGKSIVTVSGPGVTDGGATTWSLTSTTGADACTYPSSATWYVGPLSNTPVASRLKGVGITSTSWSYGVAGGIGSSCGHSYYWLPGSLIGVSQTGNSITIASFTYAGADHGSPQDQITFTLKP
ncbi:MAG: hypothetical protein JSU00_11885 [Acidobacteria bacterium]|nr:hypothetical protein [Acidobacteriota bacterium]